MEHLLGELLLTQYYDAPVSGEAIISEDERMLYRKTFFSTACTPEPTPVSALEEEERPRWDSLSAHQLCAPPSIVRPVSSSTEVDTSSGQPAGVNSPSLLPFPLAESVEVHHTQQVPTHVLDGQYVLLFIPPPFDSSDPCFFCTPPGLTETLPTAAGTAACLSTDSSFNAASLNLGGTAVASPSAAMPLLTPTSRSSVGGYTGAKTTLADTNQSLPSLSASVQSFGGAAPTVATTLPTAATAAHCTTGAVAASLLYQQRFTPATVRAREKLLTFYNLLLQQLRAEQRVLSLGSPSASPFGGRWGEAKLGSSQEDGGDTVVVSEEPDVASMRLEEALRAAVQQSSLRGLPDEGVDPPFLRGGTHAPPTRIAVVELHRDASTLPPLFSPVFQSGASSLGSRVEERAAPVGGLRRSHSPLLATAAVNEAARAAAQEETHAATLALAASSLPLNPNSSPYHESLDHTRESLRSYAVASLHGLCYASPVPSTAAPSSFVPPSMPSGGAAAPPSASVPGASGMSFTSAASSTRCGVAASPLPPAPAALAAAVGVHHTGTRGTAVRGKALEVQASKSSSVKPSEVPLRESMLPIRGRSAFTMLPSSTAQLLHIGKEGAAAGVHVTLRGGNAPQGGRFSRRNSGVALSSHQLASEGASSRPPTPPHVIATLSAGRVSGKVSQGMLSPIGEFGLQSSQPRPSGNLIPSDSSASTTQAARCVEAHCLGLTPLLSFASGLDRGVIQDNPFYGGWYAARSTEAYRRVIAACGIHSWPAVVLIGPQGEVITTLGLDKIEEDLRSVVIMQKEDAPRAARSTQHLHQRAAEKGRGAAFFGGLKSDSPEPSQRGQGEAERGISDSSPTRSNRSSSRSTVLTSASHSYQPWSTGVLGNSVGIDALAGETKSRSYWHLSEFVEKQFPVMEQQLQEYTTLIAGLTTSSTAGATTAASGSAAGAGGSAAGTSGSSPMSPTWRRSHGRATIPISSCSSPPAAPTVPTTGVTSPPRRASQGSGLVPLSATRRVSVSTSLLMTSGASHSSPSNPVVASGGLLISPFPSGKADPVSSPSQEVGVGSTFLNDGLKPTAMGVSLSLSSAGSLTGIGDARLPALQKPLLPGTGTDGTSATPPLPQGLPSNLSPLPLSCSPSLSDMLNPNEEALRSLEGTYVDPGIAPAVKETGRFREHDVVDITVMGPKDQRVDGASAPVGQAGSLSISWWNGSTCAAEGSEAEPASPYTASYSRATTTLWMGMKSKFPWYAPILPQTEITRVRRNTSRPVKSHCDPSNFLSPHGSGLLTEDSSLPDLLSPLNMRSAPATPSPLDQPLHVSWLPPGLESLALRNRTIMRFRTRQDTADPLEPSPYSPTSDPSTSHSILESAASPNNDEEEKPLPLPLSAFRAPLGVGRGFRLHSTSVPGSFTLSSAEGLGMGSQSEEGESNEHYADAVHVLPLSDDSQEIRLEELTGPPLCSTTRAATMPATATSETGGDAPPPFDNREDWGAEVQRVPYVGNALQQVLQLEQFYLYPLPRMSDADPAMVGQAPPPPTHLIVFFGAGWHPDMRRLIRRVKHLIEVLHGEKRPSRCEKSRAKKGRDTRRGSGGVASFGATPVALDQVTGGMDGLRDLTGGVLPSDLLPEASPPTPDDKKDDEEEAMMEDFVQLRDLRDLKDLDEVLLDEGEGQEGDDPPVEGNSFFDDFGTELPALSAPNEQGRGAQGPSDLLLGGSYSLEKMAAEDGMVGLSDRHRGEDGSVASLTDQRAVSAVATSEEDAYEYEEEEDPKVEAEAPLTDVLGDVAEVDLPSDPYEGRSDGLLPHTAGSCKEAVLAVKRKKEMEKRLAEAREDEAELPRRVAWAASPIRVEVLYVSLDDNLSDLRKTLKRMPRSWKCLSGFGPHWLVDEWWQRRADGVLTVSPSSRCSSFGSRTPRHEVALGGRESIVSILTTNAVGEGVSRSEPFKIAETGDGASTGIGRPLPPLGEKRPAAPHASPHPDSVKNVEEEDKKVSAMIDSLMAQWEVRCLPRLVVLVPAGTEAEGSVGDVRSFPLPDALPLNGLEARSPPVRWRVVERHGERALLQDRDGRSFPWGFPVLSTKPTALASEEAKKITTDAVPPPHKGETEQASSTGRTKNPSDTKPKSTRGKADSKLLDASLEKHSPSPHNEEKDTSVACDAIDGPNAQPSYHVELVTDGLQLFSPHPAVPTASLHLGGEVVPPACLPRVDPLQPFTLPTSESLQMCVGVRASTKKCVTPCVSLRDQGTLQTQRSSVCSASFMSGLRSNQSALLSDHEGETTYEEDPSASPTASLSRWVPSSLQLHEACEAALRPLSDGSTCVLLCAFGKVPFTVHMESVKVMQQAVRLVRSRLLHRHEVMKKKSAGVRRGSSGDLDGGVTAGLVRAEEESAFTHPTAAVSFDTPSAEARSHSGAYPHVVFFDTIWTADLKMYEEELEENASAPSKPSEQQAPVAGKSEGKGKDKKKEHRKEAKLRAPKSNTRALINLHKREQAALQERVFGPVVQRFGSECISKREGEVFVLVLSGSYASRRIDVWCRSRLQPLPPPPAPEPSEGSALTATVPPALSSPAGAATPLSPTAQSSLFQSASNPSRGRGARGSSRTQRRRDSPCVHPLTRRSGKTRVGSPLPVRRRRGKGSTPAVELLSPAAVECMEKAAEPEAPAKPPELPIEDCLAPLPLEPILKFVSHAVLGEEIGNSCGIKVENVHS